MGLFATTVFSATQRCNIVATLFQMVATLSNIATLCCAKNRGCELSCVTSPLGKQGRDDLPAIKLTFPLYFFHLPVKAHINFNAFV